MYYLYSFYLRHRLVFVFVAITYVHLHLFMFVLLLNSINWKMLDLFVIFAFICVCMIYQLLLVESNYHLMWCCLWTFPKGAFIIFCFCIILISLPVASLARSRTGLLARWLNAWLVSCIAAWVAGLVSHFG